MRLFWWHIFKADLDDCWGRWALLHFLQDALNILFGQFQPVTHDNMAWMVSGTFDPDGLSLQRSHRF
jgi:hypothetical protein